MPDIQTIPDLSVRADAEAAAQLASELRKGEQSAQDGGWFSIDEVEAALGNG